MELKYHIRKKWDDPKSQIGADYTYLINAKKACDKLEGYFVFNSKGMQVYPESIALKEEDHVQLMPGAKFISGNDVAAKFMNMELRINKIVNDAYEVKDLAGHIIGTVRGEFVIPYSEINVAVIEPYYVIVNKDDVNLHLEPSYDSAIIRSIPRNSMYKIVNEKNGWGKIEVGFGWIKLKGMKVLK